MQPNRIQRIIEYVAGILTALASTALAAMMLFLMATDVLCRYFFNAPIPGALELVEFGL